MALTLQNTHDACEDTIVQNVLINGMVVKKHFRSMTTVSHVKRYVRESLRIVCMHLHRAWRSFRLSRSSDFVNTSISEMM